ncbi:MAG: hypothetical protein VXW07_00610, partial [Pseudomonadota bacterium]|nr:hypothetical protein [Pseudomonadota bacterium]
SVFHIRVVFCSFILFPTPVTISLPDYAVPFDVIMIEEVTRMTSQDPQPEKKTDQAEEIEKPPVNIRQEAAPPAQVDNTNAMPLPEPKPKAAETLPEQLPAPINLVGNAVPLARPRPAKPERKPLLDTAAVQALLDKTPDIPEPTPPKPLANLPPGERMSLSEIDAFRSQIRACWSVPAGAKNAENLLVRVRVQLDPSGRPIAKKIINRAQLTDSFFLSAAESVLRAIERCQPYKMPPEKYESWREMELNFDPRKMLNG